MLASILVLLPLAPLLGADVALRCSAAAVADAIPDAAVAGVSSDITSGASALVPLLVSPYC